MSESVIEVQSEADQGARRWTLVSRALKVLMAVWVLFGVWFLGFRSVDEEVAVLPDTTPSFSLDLSLTEERLDHDLVYSVEQRARPSYRIMSLDPSSGDVETVFTVPEDAIVYGIDLNPDRDTIAVAYTTDFHTDGAGIWLLDLASGELTELSPENEAVFLTDLEWTADGAAILATRIDQSAEDEVLEIVSVSATSGEVEALIPDAITPLAGDDGVYFLELAEDQARRSIGFLAADGTSTTLAVGEGNFDLDHLINGAVEASVRVAAIESTEDDGLLSFGSPALAHGNHNVPSTWWNVFADESDATPIEPIIVYDASSTEGSDFVYVTGEGLSIVSDGEKVDLIESRAMRFVTG